MTCFMYVYIASQLFLESELSVKLELVFVTGHI